MKLPRPYIPVGTRLAVVERQVRKRHGFCPVTPSARGKAMRIRALLFALDPSVTRWELHHRPALCNRYRDDQGEYHPAANDPEYLVYVSKADHGIETRVRGLRGQHSDLGLLRKRKRKEKKATRPKFKWPKRKFPRRKK